MSEHRLMNKQHDENKHFISDFSGSSVTSSNGWSASDSNTNSDSGDSSSNKTEDKDNVMDQMQKEAEQFARTGLVKQLKAVERKLTTTLASQTGSSSSHEGFLAQINKEIQEAEL